MSDASCLEVEKSEVDLIWVCREERNRGPIEGTGDGAAEGGIEAYRREE